MNYIISSVELLPCPFCGEEAVMTVSDCALNERFSNVRVCCTNCFCSGCNVLTGEDMFSGHFTSLESAIKRASDKWNNRSKTERREAD